MRPLILVTLALAGCSSSPANYQNANGGGQVQFDRDHYQCTRENTRQTFLMVGKVAGTDQHTDDNMVQACLRARGWYPSSAEPVAQPTIQRTSPAQRAAKAYMAGDYTTAISIWRGLGDAGNAHAQKMLGVMYYKGEGVPKDYSQAAAWSRKAADQGEAEAQKNLGTMYLLGNGVPKNYSQAMQWSMKAAAGGNAGALANIGYLYEAGLGVPKDVAQARYWYSAGAAKGDDTAKRNLSRLPAQ